MRSSVFTAILDYLRDVYWGVRSVWGSCVTAIPYLFGTGDLSKEATEQYPDPISSKTADDLPPRSRGLLYNDIDRCTGCKECERQCPVTCIEVQAEPAGDETKTWVSVFNIDFSKCIFCGICSEVCKPGSLRHTREYEGSVYEIQELVAKFGRGQVTAEQREKWAKLRQQIEDDSVRI